MISVNISNNKDDILNRIEEVSAVSEEVSASTEEMTASVEELNDVSVAVVEGSTEIKRNLDQMIKGMERFKVSE